MNIISIIFSDLRAAIAARAARDRALTVLLVAVWGRIARMGARLERLIGQWRAGTLPKKRAPRAGRAAAPRSTPRFKFPTARAWLIVRVEGVIPYGTQLAHVLTDAECKAFLAAVPQAGRILRPLLRMLGVEPLPDVVRRVKPVVPYSVPEPVPGVALVGGGVSPVSDFLGLEA